MTEIPTERTRVTHLTRGDVILVQWDRKGFGSQAAPREGDKKLLRFSSPRPPRRAFWAMVAVVNRAPGRRSVESVTLELNDGKIDIPAWSDNAVTRMLPNAPALT